MQSHTNTTGSSPRSDAPPAAFPSGPPAASRDPHLRRKLILIGVLASLLIGVLYRNSQLPPDEEPAATVTEPAAAQQVATVPAPTRTMELAVTQLPEVDLTAIVRQSPFRSPVLSPDEAPTAPHAAAEAATPESPAGLASMVGDIRVSAVMERRGRRMAVVGNRIVAEGDDLGDGVHVLAIRADGIVVGPSDAPARPELNPVR